MSQKLKYVVDQMGNEVKFNYPPLRIVSLVPSQTELLYDLGLDKHVVGITKFCVQPEIWHTEKIKVGGTKKINRAVIDKLKPDLIIGNKEENEKADIEYLKTKYPVWMSDITTFEEALEMITKVGDLTATTVRGELIKESIEREFVNLKTHHARVLYLIWKNPWMGAGANTFIHALLAQLGLTNVLQDKPRYPVLTNEEIQQLNPDTLLLSSEPFPFKEKHSKELVALLPKAKIILVDGQFFSWYGSRLSKAPAYFNSLII